MSGIVGIALFLMRIRNFVLIASYQHLTLHHIVSFLLCFDSSQGGNAQSLAMTQRTIEDAAMIGSNTSVKLEHQTEQMENVIGTLHETNSVLDKSAKLLRRMRTRLVTNKLMTFIIILVELAIVALIIYIKFYT